MSAPNKAYANADLGDDVDLDLDLDDAVDMISGGIDPAVEEIWSSRALTIVLTLLILSFCVSYYLKIKRIRSVHETLVAMFAGMFVGLIVRILPGNAIQSMISFKSSILLNVLLPPIILNSGFGLKQENFFRNFPVIIVFAFAGTFISAVALGIIVYLYSLLGLEGLDLTIVECLLFGSTLSATDPVTILAIFNALHVDPKLYSIIFGESLLNDAVSIVLFETVMRFHGEKIGVLGFFRGVGMFLGSFGMSCFIGVSIGLGCSLGLKHTQLGRYHEIESCIVILLAYLSYFLSNAFTLSGIVSLLFCGVTLKHYAYHNMSRRTQRTVKAILGTLASLSENFIFIYLGLSLFTESLVDYKPVFILVTGLALCIARYAAIFPLSKLLNLFFRARGSSTDELPHSYQVMLFWAGLRGAVGVALAAGFKGEHAVVLRTTVLVGVVLTVVIFGGTIGRMIEILGIRTGVGGEDSDSDAEEYLEGVEGAYRFVQSEEDGLGMAQLPGSQNFSKGTSEYKDRFGADLRYPNSAKQSPYLSANTQMTGKVNSHSNSRRSGSILSSGSGEESSERDDEVLPSSSNGALGSKTPDTGGLPTTAISTNPSDLLRVWKDGQWFNVLDERYLLPVFSNATASRNSGGRRSKEGKEVNVTQPRRQHGDSAPTDDYNGSFTDILSSLVSGTNLNEGGYSNNSSKSSSGNLD